MAARGHFRVRSLLYWWPRNSLIKDALLHRTTVNSVSGIQCFLKRKESIYTRKVDVNTENGHTDRNYLGTFYGLYFVC